MARLDVLHIGPTDRPLLADSGGIAVHRHARALGRAGARAAIAVIPAMLDGLPASAGGAPCPPPQRVEGVDIYDLTGVAEPLVRLRALLEHHRPRVVHAHHNRHFDGAHALAQALGVPTVYTCHVPLGEPAWVELKERHARAEGITHRDCARRCDRFIAFTPAGADRIVSCLPELAGRVRVVGHGVDDRPDIEALVRAREPRSTVTVLFVGRFEVEKGVLDLFEAIPLALARSAELRFVLVGAREGTPQPAADQRVRVLPWSSRAEVERELVAADVFVSPSHFESFGMATAEAMLFGLPVVTTRTEGSRALVEPAECGVWVPRGDPEALASALVELARDPRRRLWLGRRGAEHARAALGWPDVARAMIEVYRELDPRVGAQPSS